MQYPSVLGTILKTFVSSQEVKLRVFGQDDFFYVRGAGGGRSEMKGSGRRDGEGMIMIAPVQYYSTNHKLGRTVCNFANFGRSLGSPCKVQRTFLLHNPFVQPPHTCNDDISGV